MGACIYLHFTGSAFWSNNPCVSSAEPFPLAQAPWLLTWTDSIFSCRTKGQPSTSMCTALFTRCAEVTVGSAIIHEPLNHIQCIKVGLALVTHKDLRGATSNSEMDRVGCVWLWDSFTHLWFTHLSLNVPRLLLWAFFSFSKIQVG